MAGAAGQKQEDARSGSTALDDGRGSPSCRRLCPKHRRKTEAQQSQPAKLHPFAAAHAVAKDARPGFEQVEHGSFQGGDRRLEAGEVSEESLPAFNGMVKFCAACRDVPPLEVAASIGRARLGSFTVRAWQPFS